MDQRVQTGNGVEADQVTEAAGSAVAGAVTQLLIRAHAGEPAAWDGIYALLYRDLRGLASAQLWRGHGGHTLSATAVVSETWIKLSRTKITAGNRRQLMALFIAAMRSVILDEAKRRKTEKRGSNVQLLSLSDGWDHGEPDRLDQLIGLDAALTELSRHMPRLAQVVEFRYFGGFSEEEIAAVVGIHVRTVRRDWNAARAFLLQRLETNMPADP